MKKRQQYKNMKTLNHWFSLFVIKNDALKFSALVKQCVFILGNDKTQVPPAVLTHWERMVGEVA